MRQRFAPGREVRRGLLGDSNWAGVIFYFVALYLGNGRDRA